MLRKGARHKSPADESESFSQGFFPLSLSFRDKRGTLSRFREIKKEGGNFCVQKKWTSERKCSYLERYCQHMTKLTIFFPQNSFSHVKEGKILLFGVSFFLAVGAREARLMGEVRFFFSGPSLRLKCLRLLVTGDGELYVISHDIRPCRDAEKDKKKKTHQPPKKKVSRGTEMSLLPVGRKEEKRKRNHQLKIPICRGHLCVRLLQV